MKDIKKKDLFNEEIKDFYMLMNVCSEVMK